MACLPLIERELRVALRKQQPARGRMKIAAVATVSSIFFLLIGSLSGDRSAGRTLEQGLCIAGLFFVLQAPMLTAGVLAEERRNQTLGLLFLSGLSAAEVFASKFLSSALIAFTNLLAIFPLLALPFLIGGVSYPLFLAIVCALPALMLFALGVSLLASVLTRDDGAAMVLANVIGAILCLFTPAIYFAQYHFSPAANVSTWWLCLSPAYGPYLVWHGFSSGFNAAEQAEVWKSLGLTLCWTALAMSAAAFALTGVWREREEEQESGGWRARWRKFMHGNRAGRQRLGRSWLDKNPFVWLAARDKQPATLGWLAVGAIVMVWLLCLALWPRQWPTALNVMVTAILLNLTVIWLALFAAAQQLGHARRNGDYELLLTTPLDPIAIVWGQLHALRWHFRPLVNFVLTLNILLMLEGMVERAWTQSALIVYVCIWLLLIFWTWRIGDNWTRAVPAMWISLNCGLPARAVWRMAGFKWFYWIWIWNSGFGFWRIWSRGGQPFPSGSIIQLVLALTLTGIYLLVCLLRRFVLNDSKSSDLNWDPRAKVWVPNPYAVIGKPSDEHRAMLNRLIREFREIVREPLPDPHDSRFKKWNTSERFPWGWQLIQEQLVGRMGRKPVNSDDLWKNR